VAGFIRLSGRLPDKSGHYNRGFVQSKSKSFFKICFALGKLPRYAATVQFRPMLSGSGIVILSLAHFSGERR